MAMPGVISPPERSYDGPPVVTSRGPACGSTPPRVGGIFEEAFSDAFLQAGLFFFRPRKLAEKDVSGFGIRFFVSEAQLQR